MKDTTGRLQKRVDLSQTAEITFCSERGNASSRADFLSKDTEYFPTCQKKRKREVTKSSDSGNGGLSIATRMRSLSWVLFNYFWGNGDENQKYGARSITSAGFLSRRVCWKNNAVNG